MKTNRIIVIGNGFDLSIGAKTSYTDFFVAHIKKTFLKFCNRRDGQIANYVMMNQNQEASTKLIKIYDSRNIANFRLKENLEKNIRAAASVKELRIQIKNIGFEMSFLHDFVLNLVDSIEDSNWIDVEDAYFKRLLHISNQIVPQQNNTHLLDEVKELNTAMSDLVSEFEDYLIEESEKTQDCLEPLLSSRSDSKNQTQFLLNDFFQKLRSPLPSEEFKRMDISSNGVVRESTEPILGSILYLNFNYTNFFNHIRSNIKGVENTISEQEIWIHGKIQDSTNKPIFGYANDKTEQFKSLELKNERVLLEKIKSYHYAKTKNYTRFANFLNLPYEVFIIGHSCGLSDGTLLNTIFEHKNCASIKIFHYKESNEDALEEHFFKSIEIGRHFEDKILFREKLISFDEGAKIPQI